MGKTRPNGDVSSHVGDVPPALQKVPQNGFNIGIPIGCKMVHVWPLVDSKSRAVL